MCGSHDEMLTDQVGAGETIKPVTEGYGNARSSSGRAFAGVWALASRVIYTLSSGAHKFCKQNGLNTMQ